MVLVVAIIPFPKNVPMEGYAPHRRVCAKLEKVVLADVIAPFPKNVLMEGYALRHRIFEIGKNGYGGCFDIFSQKCINGGICSTTQNFC